MLYVICFWVVKVDLDGMYDIGRDMGIGPGCALSV
jgi:hypothetical protein